MLGIGFLAAHLAGLFAAAHVGHRRMEPDPFVMGRASAEVSVALELATP